jgi:hypothetical protein
MIDAQSLILGIEPACRLSPCRADRLHRQGFEKILVMFNYQRVT